MEEFTVSFIKMHCINGCESVKCQRQAQEVCRSSILSGRNVRWPRRTMHAAPGEYSDGADRQTGRLQNVKCFFLFSVHTYLASTARLRFQSVIKCSEMSLKTIDKMLH